MKTLLRLYVFFLHCIYALLFQTECQTLASKVLYALCTYLSIDRNKLLSSCLSLKVTRNSHWLTLPRYSVVMATAGPTSSSRKKRTFKKKRSKSSKTSQFSNQAHLLLPLRGALSHLWKYKEASIMNKAEHDQLITVRRQMYESHSPHVENLSLFHPFRSESPSVLCNCGRKIFNKKWMMFDALKKSVTPHAGPHSIPGFCLAQKSSPITKKNVQERAQQLSCT